MRVKQLVFTTALMAAFITTLPTASTLAAACGTPLGNDQTTRTAVVNDAYQNWKTKYVTQNGAGGDLRVQRSGFDGYDTVSEGIAYGMLFAAYNNDKPTFDGLWAYAQKHVNGNGVMNWRIAADGSTTGYNGATDADEDIAAALVAADTTWGGYRTAALKQIDTVKRHQVEAGSFVVKPGDVWGGSNLLNPSYLAPSYYDVFQSYRGDNDWANIKSTSYRILQAAQNKTTGLLPDWSTSSGTPANGMGYNYGYDASRAPLRLALSAAWSCDQTAGDLLAPFNTWSSRQNPAQMASSYTLDGNPVDRGDAVPLIAATTAAATTSADASYRSTSWNALVNAPGTSYYPDSMRLFGLMVASGTMVNPMELARRQPAPVIQPPVVQKTFAISGSDASVTVNTGSDLRLSFTAPERRDNLILDIEIYDVSGRRVAQQIYETQTLGTDSTQYGIQWTAPAAGTYTVKAGIFTAGWEQNLSWNDRVATITAAAGTPVVVPPVTLPVPTPVIPVIPTQPVAANLSIWWPGSTQTVSGVQPFKAVVDGLDPATYEMYWQVDGGRLNKMDSVHDAAPHKLSLVDLQYWTWSGNNRYTINFVAKNLNGTVIAQKSTQITVSR